MIPIKYFKYSKLSFFNGIIYVLSFFSLHATANPAIHSIDGIITDGERMTISGSGFTSKANSRPLFYWRADDGTQPNLSIGREGWGGTTFNGNLTTKHVAPGSSHSMAWDHGNSSDKALDWVKYNSSRVYVYRKKFSDFDTTADYAIRTRFNQLAGNFEVGQEVRGEVSGATGIIQSIDVNGDKLSGSIFYSSKSGSVGLSAPVDFLYGERIYTKTGSATNDEGSVEFPTGTYRTFNYKTIRFWGTKSQNNMYVGPAYNETREMKMTPEYTGTSVWPSDWQSIKYMTPDKWVTEEFLVDSGTIDRQDARVLVKTDGQLNLDTFFKARDSKNPDKYSSIAQSQVSNGAQPNSYIYYDMLYVDDSWHRITVCSAAKYIDCRDPEIMLPIDWSDNQIQFLYRKGSLSEGQHYLYVTDKDNNTNQEGYALPLPASPSQIDLKIN